MMMPAVLHFIVCDRVLVDPMNLHRINIEGLRMSIRSLYDPPFPCRIPSVTTLAIFMGGEGVAELSIQVVDDAGVLICASTDARPTNFVGGPSDIKGTKIRVLNCVFPHSGLYWVKLVLSGITVAQQPLRVYP